LAEWIKWQNGSNGRMARWQNGQMVEWSYGRMVIMQKYKIENKNKIKCKY